MDNFGMMDGAYFVSRGELLQWINDFFQLPYTKVEQCASGALHCQIMDAVYPGKVAMSKVNFEARYDYEYVGNYKVLQNVFDKQGVNKHIDVQKLIKGKYMDNLEFLQWMKRFFDLNYRGQDYDAISRRNGKKSAATSRRAPSQPRRVATKTSNKKSAAVKSSNVTATNSAKDDENIAALAAATEEMDKLRITMDQLEKERDFFFNRLQEVEMLCHEDEFAANSLAQRIQTILYGDASPTTEEEGVDTKEN